MINPHSLKLVPTNNKARSLVAILLGLTVITLVFYGRMEHYQGLVGLLAVVLICAAVFVYTKYVTPTYYYDLTDDSDGVWVFVVRQVVGRRATTLCRISLHEITSVTRENAEERRAHKAPYGTRTYSYLPTLAPAITWRITTASPHESAEIVIEAPDEYIEFLEKYISDAKALFGDRNDE